MPLKMRQGHGHGDKQNDKSKRRLAREMKKYNKGGMGSSQK